VWAARGQPVPYDARTVAIDRSSSWCAGAGADERAATYAAAKCGRTLRARRSAAASGIDGGSASNTLPAVRQTHGAASASIHGSRKKVFESRFDGEYCACRRCVQIGYDEDSWHPVTTQFWRTAYGRIDLSMCKACIGELVLIRQGVTVAIFNAKEGIRA
jgi:hypothetical protein